MKHLTACPMCLAPVREPSTRKGILINAVARAGSHVVELEGRLASAKEPLAREHLQRELTAARATLQDLQAQHLAASVPVGNVRVLYRDQGSPSEDAEERDAIVRHFGPGGLIQSRVAVSPGDLVVGRYSVLPYYRDLEQDLLALGARLINTTTQHMFLADMRNWYPGLADLTAKTWFRLEDVDDDGPFVLKGTTNSRKQDWATHMFAADRRAAGDVYSRLAADGLIGRQDIVIRKYVPLVRYGELLGGLPITKEFRYFVLNGRVVSASYYWDSFREDIDVTRGTPPAAPTPSMDTLVQLVIARIGEQAAFYTVDVGETVDGGAILIELNDGQMAGRSGAPADAFYAALAGILAANTRKEARTLAPPAHTLPCSPAVPDDPKDAARGVVMTSDEVRALQAGRKMLLRVPVEPTGMRYDAAGRIVHQASLRVEVTKTLVPAEWMTLPASLRPAAIEPGTYAATIYDGGAVFLHTPGGEIGVKPGEFRILCPFLDDSGEELRTCGFRPEWELLEIPPGQMLWVREEVWVTAFVGASIVRLRYADGETRRADLTPEQRARLVEGGESYFAARDMPRWASRFRDLEVGYAVTLERLQAVSSIGREGGTDDAIEEGYVLTKDAAGPLWGAIGQPPTSRTAYGLLARVWDAKYPDTPWAADPWVWVVTFRRETATPAENGAST